MAYYKMTKIAIVCPSTEEIHAWLDAGNDPNELHPKYGLLLKSVIQDHNDASPRTASRMPGCFWSAAPTPTKCYPPGTVSRMAAAF